MNQANRDQDRDHLSNRGEFRAGDDPRDHDSDNDGVMDGDENAGTITSYDTTTGKLTITLFGGDTVSGIVTDETRIRCEHEHHHGDDDSTASVSRHGEDEDNSGPGNSSDDEDNSGPGNAGDDEDNSGPGNSADEESSGPSGGGADDPADHDENDDRGDHQHGDDPPGHDQNDDHGDDHQHGDDPPGHDGTPPGSSEGPGRGADHTANCTPAALVVGATVEEAELRLEHGVATFEEIELEDQGDSTTTSG